jgi:hypothetical protein
LYNYADDNTLSFSSPDYDILISTLEAESQVLIDWFKDNKMHKLIIYQIKYYGVSNQKLWRDP